jgi:hypothetical protein
MSQEYTITEQNGQFVYKEGDFSITLYEDGLAIHGARDPFANETWNVLFGNDVAAGLLRLFRDPAVRERLLSQDT